MGIQTFIKNKYSLKFFLEDELVSAAGDGMVGELALMFPTM